MTRRKYHRPLRDDTYTEREERDMFHSPNPKRFYRSRTDKVWLGVCGGAAERFGWEPTLVRIAFIASFFVFGPLSFFGYIVVAMITPKAPRGRRNLGSDEEQFWRNVSDRPRVTASGLKYTFMDLEDRLRNIERNVTSEEWRLKKAFRDLEKN